MNEFVRDVMFGATIVLMIVTLILIAIPLVVYKTTGVAELPTISVEQLIREANSGDLLAFAIKPFNQAHGYLFQSFTASVWNHVAMVWKPTDTVATSGSTVPVEPMVIEIYVFGFSQIPLREWIKLHHRKGRQVVWRKLKTDTSSTNTADTPWDKIYKSIDTKMKVDVDYIDWFGRRFFNSNDRKPTDKQMYCTEFVYDMLQRAGVVPQGKCDGKGAVHFTPAEVIDTKFKLSPPYIYADKKLVVA